MEYVPLTDLDVPSVISKDECLYCFASVYNECPDVTNATSSLNLCLKTFQSVCNRHLPFHSQVIRKYAGLDDLQYLNIYKVKKSEVNNHEDLEKNNNKKIKLHVVEKSEDEIYDTFWTLLKYDASKLYSETLFSSTDSIVPSVTASKINDILRTKSQDMLDQTNSWELSINSCSHVKSFSVPEGPSRQLTEKCADCELSANLWLCLHCGNLGCGREQVGIEGHSHAKKHHEKNSNHVLAVKLGSLSESSCDIYCYSCDDEVKFDERAILIQTLSKYGIDLSAKRANEKTLVELQVEQNMNWDFQMTDSKGQDLTKLPANKEFGCGLINLGNSCYLNSVIQCLLNGGVRNYSWDGLGHDFPLDVVFPNTNLRCQLIKLNNAIKLEPEIYQDGIRPKSFKKCVGQLNEEFSSGRQQDALEFLTYLTDTLDSKLMKKLPRDPNNLLKCVMEDKLKCKKCGKVKYTSQLSEALQVPLLEDYEAQDLMERLRDYFSSEELEFKCPTNCEGNTAIKSSGFKTFPDTLIISPIRIRLENWTPVKTSSELLVPGLEDPSAVLDISQFRLPAFDPKKEELIPEDDEATDKFLPNAASVGQLTEMGFGFNAISRALYSTGNQETEAAMNWLFQHMEDSDLNDAFSPPPSTQTMSIKVDQDSLDNMIAMGLDPKLCRKALVLNNGNVNTSVEWVFSNMDDDGEIPQIESPHNDSADETSYGHPDPAHYELTAVVCHKGNSVQSGHYVAFIRKEIANEKKWILFNDEKIVVASRDSLAEIKKNGYFFFYSRI